MYHISVFSSLLRHTWKDQADLGTQIILGPGGLVVTGVFSLLWFFFLLRMSDFWCSKVTTIETSFLICFVCFWKRVIKPFWIAMPINRSYKTFESPPIISAMGPFPILFYKMTPSQTQFYLRPNYLKDWSGATMRFWVRELGTPARWKLTLGKTGLF